MAHAIWLQIEYSRSSLKEEKDEELQDSISKMRHDVLLHSIQMNTQLVDSLLRDQKHIDSVIVETHQHSSRQMDNLIKVCRQILKQSKEWKCSISSIIHTAE